jgi:hypothetical protein
MDNAGIKARNVDGEQASMVIFNLMDGLFFRIAQALSDLAQAEVQGMLFRVCLATIGRHRLCLPLFGKSATQVWNSKKLQSLAWDELTSTTMDTLQKAFIGRHYATFEYTGVEAEDGASHPAGAFSSSSAGHPLAYDYRVYDSETLRRCLKEFYRAQKIPCPGRHDDMNADIVFSDLESMHIDYFRKNNTLFHINNHGGGQRQGYAFSELCALRVALEDYGATVDDMGLPISKPIRRDGNPGKISRLCLGDLRKLVERSGFLRSAEALNTKIKSEASKRKDRGEKTSFWS